MIARASLSQSSELRLRELQLSAQSEARVPSPERERERVASRTGRPETIMGCAEKQCARIVRIAANPASPR